MPRHASLAQFELFVLLSLVHNGGAAVGAEVARNIFARSGRRASLGAVYSALNRLESRGWVEHEITEARPVRGGRPRKRFLITDTGSEELQQSVQQVLRMLGDSGDGLPHGAS